MLVDFFKRAAKVAEEEGAREGEGVAAKRRRLRERDTGRVTNILSFS